MTTYGRFLAMIVAICAVGLFACHVFVRSSAFCRHTDSYVNIPSCYQYAVHGKNVDVLLVGDSSLLHGIRPALIERATGIRSYNFGMLGPGFFFDPADVIDHWLARNATPKAVIVYISPWALIHPGRFTDPGWFAYALTQLQYGDFAKFAAVVRERPSVLVEIPQIVGTVTVPGTSIAAARRAVMDRNDGHLPYTPPGALPPPTAADDCSAFNPPLPPPTDDAMRAALTRLRARYGRRGLPVYLYIAPIARCDGALALVRRALAGVADNIPVALPDRFFVMEGGVRRHVHVNADGEVPVSLLAARFVADKLGASAR